MALQKVFPQCSCPFVMAPMVGLSHAPMRILVSSYFPEGQGSLYFTEMLNSRRLPHQKLKENPMTNFAQDEARLVPQLLGNEEAPIRDSLQKLQELNPLGIDINMGCPVDKALRHNYGVALMGDLSYAQKVVEVTLKHSPWPVGVKLRAIEKDQNIDLADFCLGLEKAGASWLTLHPRTPKQKRRGQANWEEVKRVKSVLRIPLIGNGDIQTAYQALDYLRSYKADGVMVGRALCARPWLLAHADELLKGNTTSEFPQDSSEEAYALGLALLKLYELMDIHFEQKWKKRKFLFYLRYASAWLNFGLSLQKQVQAKDWVEIPEVLRNFFARPGLLLTQYTQLR